MSYWYNNLSAPHNDIVVSTRIRLARNINGMPFPSKMTPQQFKILNKMVKDAISKSEDPFVKTLKYIDMKDVPVYECYAMVERHIISRKFASNYENRSIIISDDESVCIMIGEEDHIRIQVLLAGLQIEAAYKIADRIDSILCQSLDIAFDNRIGFLTECPTNVGTGLRASVMMHLPLTQSYGAINEITDSLSKIGFTVRGMYGEGTKALASLYQVSNQLTLGISEQEAIDGLNTVAMRLITKEENYRKQTNAIKLEDRCMRSFGILKNARIISSNEAMSRLSDLQLAMAMGIIDLNVWPISFIIECQPYMQMRKTGGSTPEERDIMRANELRKLL